MLVLTATCLAGASVALHWWPTNQPTTKVARTPTAPTTLSGPRTHPLATSSGPTLTWAGYKGVHLGEDMVAAATALGGTSTGDCPPPNGTYDVITGIGKDVVITDEGAGTANVNVIQLTGQSTSGPDGIRAGMTISQARAISGQPLVATVSPTTGQNVYTITQGNTVFGFYADPRVSDLTLTTTSAIQQGILGGGFGGC